MIRLYRSRPDEAGVILLHVLSVVAVCSAIMAALLSLQQAAIDRTAEHADRARSAALVRAAEVSAIVALRRDAREAPESDFPAETWGQVSEDGVAIAGGRFEIIIWDEQGRFNLNNLLTDGLLAQDVLERLLAWAGDRDPRAAATAIADLVKRREGIEDLRDLMEAGVPADVIDRLREVVCVLPEPTRINLNSAPEPVLAALLGNAPAARLLAARRDRLGQVVAADFVAAGVLPPSRSGFQSRFFAAEIAVRRGDVETRMLSRIVRRTAMGRPDAVVWRRSMVSRAHTSQPRGRETK